MKDHLVEKDLQSASSEEDIELVSRPSDGGLRAAGMKVVTTITDKLGFTTVGDRAAIVVMGTGIMLDQQQADKLRDELSRFLRNTSGDRTIP